MKFYIPKYFLMVNFGTTMVPNQEGLIVQSKVRVGINKTFLFSFFFIIMTRIVPDEYY
jgi:hypothetical protein